MSAILKAMSNNLLVRGISLLILLGGLMTLPAQPAPGATHPLTDLPLLNNRLSAQASLVLDMDGDIQYDYGYPGNTIVTPAYDIDGDPNTFSDQELANIRMIWARVAEDYAPYNINVTTVDTGNLDDFVTMKIIIGGDGAWAGGGPGGGVCGGWAFTNPNIRNTGFVFGQDQGVYIGYVASHESGHSFGLGHQSLFDPNTGVKTMEYNPGDANWGPTMGGAWGRYITWSHGTSGGVDMHQNDMQALAKYNLDPNTGKGFTYVGDRAGNQKETAAMLRSVNTGVSQTGVIVTNTDQNYYRFKTTGGTVNISVTPAFADPNDSGAANLVPTLEIRNSSGTLVASATTPGEPSTSISQSLSAGDYFLVVKSNGLSGYDPYGFSGSYVLTGAVPGIVPTLTWDGSTSSPGLQEGAGTWNTTDTNRWYNGGSYQAWSNSTPANAVFGLDLEPNAANYTITLGTAITANSITLNRGAHYTLSGSTLTLSTGGRINSNFGTTISSNIVLGGPVAFTSSEGTLTINGTVTTGGNTLTVGGASDTQIGGVISGAGSLYKAESGALILTATNTYTGRTTIAGGVLRATQGRGLPSSNLVLAGGALETSGSFTRSLGTSSNRVQFVSGTTPTGFSARGGALTVNIGGSGSTLTWGASNFNPTGGLLLNADSADSALTFSNGLALAGAARTFYVGANTATISKALTGTSGSGIVKQGAGTLVLTQAVGFTGPLTINAGTLDTNNNNLTVTSLNMGGDSWLTSSNLNLGTGTLTLQGNLTYNAWANNGATISGNVSLSAVRTFTIQSGGAFTFNGTVSGAGGIAKDGFGTMALGNNSYTGATTVYKGVIQMNSANAFGTTASGTTFYGGGVQALQSTAEPFTIAGDAYFDDWGGSPVLSGSVTVNSGATWTLSTGGGNWMGVNGSISGAGGIYLNHNPTWAPITFGGTAANTLSGTVTLGGGGILLAKPAGVDAIAGNVTIGTANRAYLVLGANEQVKNTSVITLAGSGDSRAGALQLAGYNETVAGIVSNAPGEGIIENTHASNASTLTLSPASGSYEFSGVIRNGGAGTLALVKAGAGTQVLSGANTYTGATTISGGKLAVNGSLAAASAVSVASGATLAGTGNVAGTATLASGGHVAPGAAGVGSIGTLTAGNLSLTTAQLDFDLGTPVTDMIQLNSGALTATGVSTFNFNDMGIGVGGYVLIDYGTFSGSISNFTCPSTLNGYNLSLRDTGTSINLKVLDSSGEWVRTSSGNWVDASNWSAGIPNAVGAKANFLDYPTAPVTITLNQAVTVGSIVFGNAYSYTVSGANALTFDTTGANATITSSQSDHAISAPIVLNKSLDVTTAADKTLTLSGNISGAGGLNATGSGTLLLSGNNTFGGPVGVNAGTLKLSGGNAIANTVAVTVASGTTLDVNGTDETVGSVTSSGTIAMNSGTLRMSDTSTVAGLTGSGAIYKTASGTLYLGNNSAYTGTFNITGSTVFMNGGANSFGDTSGGTTLNAGSVINAIGSTAENFTIAGNATYGDWGGSPVLSGTTTVNSGVTLTINTGGGNWLGLSGVLAGSGNALLQHNYTWAPITIYGSAANTLSGTWTLENGGILLAKTAGVDAIAGNVIVGTSAKAYLQLAADNQIKDTAVLTLQGSGDARAGALQLCGYSDAIGGLVSYAAGDGIVENAVGSTVSTLTISPANGATYAFSGIMRDGSAGTLSLAKSGLGRQNLSGANTYTGATTITAGTLAVTGSGAINSTSGITLNGGTLLQDSSTAMTGTITFTSGTIGGTGTYSGNISLGSCHIASGDGGAGTFTISGNLSMTANSVLDYQLASLVGPNDLISMTGSLVLDGTLNITDLGGLQGGKYTLISGFSGLTDNGLNIGSVPGGHQYTISTDASHVYVTVAPEPASLVLLALGGMGVLLRRNRRS